MRSLIAMTGFLFCICLKALQGTHSLNMLTQLFSSDVGPSTLVTNKTADVILLVLRAYSVITLLEILYHLLTQPLALP